jgi:serine/threonine protein kinase
MSAKPSVFPSIEPMKHQSTIIAQLRKCAHIDILKDDIDTNKIDYEVKELRGSFGLVKIIYLDTVDKLYAKKIIKLGYGECISEILFLSSLYNDFSKNFIPKILSVKIDGNCESIEIDMTYCGYDLSYYMKSVDSSSLIKKIQFIPSLIIQMSQFLCWMESHNVVHMDIKPKNICFDKNTEKLYFVDFGFVGPCCKYSEKYRGTYIFGMMSYLLGKKSIHYEYDMFSCAMTIMSFISGDYLDDNAFIKYDSKKNIKSISYDNYKLEFIAKYGKFFSSIDMLLGPNYVYILKKMLYFNADTNFIDFNLANKITPIELYNMFPNVAELNRLRMKYPLEEQFTILEISRLSNSLEKRQRHTVDTISLYKEMKNSVVEYMANICLDHDCLHLFYHSVQIFNQLVNTINSDIGIVENSLMRYGLCCVLISNFIFQSIIDNKLSNLRNSPNLINNLYNSIQILDSIICVCERLHWQLYPKKTLLDWNMDLDKNWLLIFYIPKIDFIVEKYNSMIENMNSKIEEYIDMATTKAITKDVLNTIIESIIMI